MSLLANPPRQSLPIAGIEILRLSRDESFDIVRSECAKRPTRIAWIYANCVNILRRDDAYRQAISKFEFVLNDGAGVELAARLLGYPVVDNLCGTDWIPEFLNRLNSSNDQSLKRVFLLGATPDRLHAAVTNFKRRWPNLELCGSQPGYFESDAIAIAAIAAANPHILIVGLGVPKQELFLAQNWHHLVDSGLTIAISGGAIVDHVAGAITRAPIFFRRMRLEWLYRLVTEPRRLWRRYLIGNILFFKDLFQEWLKKN